MTAMIAGGVIAVVTGRVVHITGNEMMLIDFTDMAIKRPHRPVTKGA